MLSLPSLLIFVHVAAVVIWIGSSAAVGLILAAADGTAKLRGQIALGVYRRLASPAFVIAFLAGTARLVSSAHYYFVDRHFMHAKLPLALAIIAMQHMLGGRARKVASGATEDTSKSLGRVWLMLICAVGAVFLVVVEPF